MWFRTVQKTRTNEEADGKNKRGSHRYKEPNEGQSPTRPLAHVVKNTVLCFRRVCLLWSHWNVLFSFLFSRKMKGNVRVCARVAWAQAWVPIAALLLCFACLGIAQSEYIYETTATLNSTNCEGSQQVVAVSLSTQGTFSFLFCQLFAN